MDATQVAVCVFACLAVQGSTGSSLRRRICYHENTPLEESFLQLPGLAPSQDPIRHSSRTTYLTGDRKCPPPGQLGGHICPWFYKLNFDRQRSPSIIIEAVCSCRSCRNTGRLRSDLCQPVYTPRTVLRYTNRGCMEWSTELFAVACSCVLGHVRPVPHRSQQ